MNKIQETIRKTSGYEIVRMDTNRGKGDIYYLDNETYISESKYGGYYIWEDNEKTLALKTQDINDVLDYIREFYIPA